MPQSSKLNWPKPGDKLKFKGKTRCFHTNVEENGEKLEKLGRGLEYTVREIDVASSWTLIKLEQFPETDKFGEDWFSLSFFEWEVG